MSVVQPIKLLHPGELFALEILPKFSSLREVARALEMDISDLKKMCFGRGAFNKSTAHALARVAGNSHAFWQTAFENWRQQQEDDVGYASEHRALHDEIAEIVNQRDVDSRRQ